MSQSMRIEATMTKLFFLSKEIRPKQEKTNRQTNLLLKSGSGNSWTYSCNTIQFRLGPIMQCCTWKEINKYFSSSIFSIFFNMDFLISWGIPKSVRHMKKKYLVGFYTSSILSSHDRSIHSSAIFSISLIHPICGLQKSYRRKKTLLEFWETYRRLYLSYNCVLPF